MPTMCMYCMCVCVSVCLSVCLSVCAYVCVLLISTVKAGLQYTCIYSWAGPLMEKQFTVPAQLLAQLASSGLMHLLLHSSSSFPPLLLAHLQIFYNNSSLVCVFAPSWRMECCLYISSGSLLQEALPWVPIILVYTPLAYTCK